MHSRPMRSSGRGQVLLTVAFAACGFAGHAQMVQAGEEEARIFKTLDAGIQQYVKLQKDVEASLPALKPTREVARIDAHRRALARKIRQARRGAHQGDIFTHEATRQIRRIICDEFQGSEAPLARRTIRPDDPSKTLQRLRVNDVYPEDIPLTTMPPTLLNKLPQLPRELAYRIVGRDLAIKDTKAGLIVDYIPDVIP